MFNALAIFLIEFTIKKRVDGTWNENLKFTQRHRPQNNFDYEPNKNQQYQ